MNKSDIVNISRILDWLPLKQYFFFHVVIFYGFAPSFLACRTSHSASNLKTFSCRIKAAEKASISLAMSEKS